MSMKRMKKITIGASVRPNDYNSLSMHGIGRAVLSQMISHDFLTLLDLFFCHAIQNSSHPVS